MNLIAAPFGDIPEGTDLTLFSVFSWLLATAILIFAATKINFFSKKRTALRARYAEIWNQSEYRDLDFEKARAEILGTRSWAVPVLAVLAAIAISATTMALVVVPAAQTENRVNQQLQDRWYSTVARWAKEEYGVTDGISDLHRGDGFFESVDYLPVRVIAQGKVQKVTLSFIGKTPVLVESGDSTAELPRLSR